MKIEKIQKAGLCAVLLALTLVNAPVQASHRVMLFNQNAMDKIMEMWPDFVESVNNQSRGMEKAGDRGIITQAPLRADDRTQASTKATPATPSATVGKTTSASGAWPASFARIARAASA